MASDKDEVELQADFIEACRVLRLDPEVVINRFMERFVIVLTEHDDSPIGRWLADEFEGIEEIFQRSSQAHPSLKKLISLLDDQARDILENVAVEARERDLAEISLDHYMLAIANENKNIFFKKSEGFEPSYFSLIDQLKNRVKGSPLRTEGGLVMSIQLVEFLRISYYKMYVERKPAITVTMLMDEYLGNRSYFDNGGLVPERTDDNPEPPAR